MDSQITEKEENLVLDFVRVNIRASSREQMNLRPIVTVKGNVQEWQLLLSKEAQLDYGQACNGPKPTPGNPIVAPTVVRFHPRDIEVPSDWKYPEKVRQDYLKRQLARYEWQGI